MSRMQVEVLMSTYNGAKYVERQILSILNQENVSVHITVRDDGSSDDTIGVINKLIDQYKEKITLHCCKNVGYRKSFLELLSLANEADYYSFSDQDDIWLQDKLYSAVTKLYKVKNPIRLYTSNLYILDEKLNLLGKTMFRKDYAFLASDFCRHRYAGCTYVFSHGLKELANKINRLDLNTYQFPDHDFFLSALAFSCGSVYLDENAYINHIRYADSVTAGGNGLIKRIKVEFNSIFKKSNRNQLLGKLLLDNYSGQMNNDSIDFLNLVSSYKDSIHNKLKLLRQPRFKTGIFICDLETLFKIIISRY